ncbi:DJ-1/PfpI/YhbO family deglycase/protease [Gordonia otitidis]|uniref:DJ-1/PfpI/YhbO family deglycase/protease n=1 Tax=Gordonia otitidis TaxID=249058 RepID=UPI001D14CF00|nr:DJ-1/PfpI/YhbO family deglycase/protease [Gordonia otitidis]UEA59613.1 DJ-1/PfpI/YhbO family deglycase/protease [Gordonia otitidis]
MALSDKKALIIATSYGVERDELLVPRDHLRDEGVAVTVATVDGDDVQTLVGDKDPGSTVAADAAIADVDPADFDVLVVPGGTLNADTLRTDATAQSVVRGFAEAGKPVAAICHGPWLIVETGLLVGKTLTSYPSLRTDVNNAGGNWVDEAVVSDDTNGFTLITSRTPDDLPDFTGAIDAQLA